ncbi:hypothetical protein RB599_004750 [Gaeumannomyces hyphopodioides]
MYITDAAKTLKVLVIGIDYRLVFRLVVTNFVIGLKTELCRQLRLLTEGSTAIATGLLALVLTLAMGLKNLIIHVKPARYMAVALFIWAIYTTLEGNVNRPQDTDMDPHLTTLPWSIPPFHPACPSGTRICLCFVIEKWEEILQSLPPFVLV